jgi:hypothetical protein
MWLQNSFIRNIDAGDLLEDFLIASVSSVLFIRFYLFLAHYPQLGGRSFHIAHLLFGGFFMLFAIILLLAYLNRPILQISAVLGGIGFGTFIDELGKFITQDNNYFYQPTPALIYIIFTLVVVGVTGPETTEIATIGLSSKIGLIALAIGSLFSIIAMSSSFMTLGTAIKGIFQYDYRLKPTNALVATLSIPLILFLIGFREFFGVVSVVGALGVGLSGLITLLVFWRSRRQGLRKPEYSISNWLAVPATALIGLIFVLGLIYTL